MSHLTRRRLLQLSGLAMGSALCGPLVRDVWAATPKPSRLVIVVEGNCFYPSTVASTATHAAVAAAGGASFAGQFYGSTSRYKHKTPLTVLDSGLGTAPALAPLAAAGLASKAAVVLGLSSEITGGGHSTRHGALSCMRGGSAPGGPTIDTVLGAKLKRSSPFDVVRLGAEESSARVSYATCAFAARRAAPIVLNTADAFRRLFGIAVSGSSNPAVAQNARLLDFVRKDVDAAMATFSGSSAERAKLEAYAMAVEGLRGRNTQLASMASGVLPYAPPAPAGEETDVLERLAVHFDLATAALMGGLTNVAVLVSGPGGGLGNVYRSIYESIPGWPTQALGMNRHILQHGIQIPLHQQAITAVTRRHVELIASMAQKLAAVPEPSGGGTMLDHTAIVFLSDNGEAHHSAAREWPVLLVGGSALGLKTDGRTVVYPTTGSSRRQLSNMFNTVGYAVGETTLDEFGGEGPLRVAPGPLSEVFA